MSAVLIMSSFVAAGQVGGGIQAAAMARMGVRAVLAPTVVFGRHPGLGQPGGGPVADEMFESILAGIEADDQFRHLSAVLCGYFASPGQISAAVRAIGAVRRARPDIPILVDPVMGDDESDLYVSPPVAAAIATDLAPLADILLPNAWELARLTGRPVRDLSQVRAAASALGGTVVVSSVPVDGEIGTLLCSREGWILARHARTSATHKGAGDLLAGLFAGALAEGSSLEEALGAAVAATAAEVIGASVNVSVVRLDD